MLRARVERAKKDNVLVTGKFRDYMCASESEFEAFTPPSCSEATITNSALYAHCTHEKDRYYINVSRQLKSHFFKLYPVYGTPYTTQALQASSTHQNTQTHLLIDG